MNKKSLPQSTPFSSICCYTMKQNDRFQKYGILIPEPILKTPSAGITVEVNRCCRSTKPKERKMVSLF